MTNKQASAFMWVVGLTVWALACVGMYHFTVCN